MQLLPEIEASDCVLFIDAINTGSAPGTIAVVERAELPRYFERKLSPHQVDLREVLAICELRGTLPRVTVAFGAQPQTHRDVHRASARHSQARVDAVADLVAERLQRPGARRPAPPAGRRVAAARRCTSSASRSRSAGWRRRGRRAGRLAELVTVGVEVGDDAGVEPESLAFCLETLLAQPPFGRHGR